LSSSFFFLSHLPFHLYIYQVIIFYPQVALANWSP
jgi:hypothetical protein